MRLVPLEFIKEGNILGKSLYNDSGQLLIAKNTGLTNSMLRKIKSLGYSSIYIASEYTEHDIEHIVKPKFINKALILNRKISQMIIDQPKSLKSSLHELSFVITEIIDEILASKEIFLNLINVSTYDEYTYKHSLNVMFLAISLGRSMGYTRNQLYELAIGALFHDIGKMFVPKDILLKPSNLTIEEFELMKNHSERGFTFLREYTDLSALIRIVSLDHHEKWDGTGYPHGKKGEEIHPYGRIVAVCDVFEALTSNRPYRKEVPLFEAREYISGGGGTYFDYNVVKAFNRTVNPYTIGCYVKLSDGREGIVRNTNENYYTRPVVEIHCEEGHKVVPYTFNLLEINNVTVNELIYDFSFNNAG